MQAARRTRTARLGGRAPPRWRTLAAIARLARLGFTVVRVPADLVVRDVPAAVALINAALARSDS